MSLMKVLTHCKLLSPKVRRSKYIILLNDCVAMQSAVTLPTTVRPVSSVLPTTPTITTTIFTAITSFTLQREVLCR